MIKATTLPPLTLFPAMDFGTTAVGLMAAVPDGVAPMDETPGLVLLVCGNGALAIGTLAAGTLATGTLATGTTVTGTTTAGTEDDTALTLVACGAAEAGQTVV
jgi:hypothetical protein